MTLAGNARLLVVPLEASFNLVAIGLIIFNLMD